LPCAEPASDQAAHYKRSTTPARRAAGSPVQQTQSISSPNPTRLHDLGIETHTGKIAEVPKITAVQLGNRPKYSGIFSQAGLFRSYVDAPGTRHQTAKHEAVANAERSPNLLVLDKRFCGHLDQQV
jgi:hypothetical protein